MGHRLIGPEGDVRIVNEPQKEKDRNPSPSARPGLVAMVVLAAAIGWSYRSSFTVLIDRWSRDDNYSHGWVIVPISLAILWQRRDRLPSLQPRGRWWNFIPLAALLAGRYWLYETNDKWLEGASIPFVVGATVFAIGGWGLLRWALPAVIYLFFLIPLPPRFNDLLAGPLQTLATQGSVALLQAINQPVLAEGNVIWIGTQRLEVAEACRGLSMLLTFVALITAMVILVKRPLWERIVLLTSTIPIALICNIIRIAVTAVFYAKFDRPVQTAHDISGYAMMILALAFVMLELKIMSWLVIEDATVETSGLFRASYGPNPGPR